MSFCTSSSLRFVSCSSWSSVGHGGHKVVIIIDIYARVANFLNDSIVHYASAKKNVGTKTNGQTPHKLRLSMVREGDTHIESIRHTLTVWQFTIVVWTHTFQVSNWSLVLFCWGATICWCNRLVESILHFGEQMHLANVLNEYTVSHP